jgi:phage terminase large subunit
VDEHAEMIKELDLDRRVKKSVADHDAEGRETLNREGVSTVNADKNVGDGILAVKKRLSFDERGKANLYFMEGARCHKPDPELVSYEGSNDVPLKTVEEISSYVWDEDDDEDKPVKENDHGMDSMRYLVYTLDGGIDISSEEIERLKEIAEGF